MSQRTVAQRTAPRTMDFDLNATVGEVLAQMRQYYGLPHLRWDGVHDLSRRAVTYLENGTTHVLVDDTHGARYTVDFRGMTGVRGNIALNAADQANMAAGPGSLVFENRAEGQSTKQRNVSLCTIM